MTSKILTKDQLYYQRHKEERKKTSLEYYHSNLHNLPFLKKAREFLENYEKIEDSIITPEKLITASKILRLIEHLKKYRDLNIERQDKKELLKTIERLRNLFIEVLGEIEI